MWYLRGLVCVLALGVMPILGCTDGDGTDLCEGVMCEDGGNECTEDVCNPADGTCGVPVENGTVCSDGICLDGDCTETATVSGVVYFVETFGDDQPAPSATVSVRGTSLSTTTDEQGEFAFDVPIGYVFMQSSQTDTWGLIDGWPVPQEGLTNAELIVVADGLVAEWSQDIGRSIDETKGIVFPFFEAASGMGGETVELSEQYDFASTLDGNGDWVISNALVEGGEDWLTFVGVELTEQLTVTPKGNEGETCYLADCWRGMCVPADPQTVYPVEAKFYTTFDIVCVSEQ